MNRNNPFRIAIWTMLSSFGLAVAMAVPNLDSTRAMLLAGHLHAAGNPITTIGEKSEFAGSFSDPLNVNEPGTTPSSNSLSVLLGPITPNNTTSHEGPVHDDTARNVSAAEIVSEELELNGTPEPGFDTARLESHLVELLEKVDRLEHLQIQRQMSVPEPSAYLFIQNQLSRQIEELEDRLQTFSTNQPGQHSVTITPDAHKSIWKTTRSKHDLLSPERKQDEKSSDRISLPRIIPKGTPW